MTQTVNVIPVELTELRAASTAAGGTVLGTTATGAATPLALGIVPIPFGSDYVSITPRNFAGCAVARVSLNPYLTIFYTKDAGVTVVDISDEMQDGDATDVAIDSLGAAGTGYIYVGSKVPFRGVAVDIGTGPSGQANTLTVKYLHNNNVWTDISDTDSTDTGASFAVDATVTWTPPTTWAKRSLSVIGDTLPATTRSLHQAMYWTRWEWDVSVDSDTDIQQMLSLGRSTAYAELLEGQTLEVKLSDREIGNIQGITDAGSANLVVNVGTLIGSEFE